MKEMDIIKGVKTLNVIAKDIGAIIDYCDNNKIEYLLPYVSEIQGGCEVLTDIFEKTFLDMIAEKERIEDDGK